MTESEAQIMSAADLGIRDTADPTTGELQLSERASLQRIAGLSTELTDVTEVEYRQLRLELVVLVGVWTEGSSEQARASLTGSTRSSGTAISSFTLGSSFTSYSAPR
mgnify:CR=1 FL=1